MAIGFNKAATIFAGIALAVGVAGSAWAGDYAGGWTLYDTGGQSFEATLNEDGTAAGTHGDAMKHGTWKEIDGAAVIEWDTGWTTRIAKHGDKYVKTAFKPGTSLDDQPTNSSAAEKH